MGIKERAFGPLPPVSLDDLIPPDHFYRHLDRTLDPSFVRDLVRHTYQPYCQDHEGQQARRLLGRDRLLVVGGALGAASAAGPLLRRSSWRAAPRLSTAVPWPTILEMDHRPELSRPAAGVPEPAAPPTA
jgi:hypothetical protein